MLTFTRLIQLITGIILLTTAAVINGSLEDKTTSKGKTVLLFGGNNHTNSYYYPTMNDTRCLNTSTKIFYPCQPLLSARTLFASAILNDTVLAIGGYNRIEGHLRSVDGWKIPTNRSGHERDVYGTTKWTKNVLPPLLFGSTQISAAVVNNSVYVFGGLPSFVQKWDGYSATWQTVASLPKPYVGMKAVSLNNEILYGVGGAYGTLYEPSSNLLQYSPTDDRWFNMASMKQGRNFPAATSLNGMIYVAGGKENNFYWNTMEKYNPKEDQWTHTANMTYARWGASMVPIDDDTLLVCGGYGQFKDSFPMHTCEEYTVSLDQWAKPYKMKVGRYDFGMEVV